MRIRNIRSQTNYPGGTWQRRPRRIRHAPPCALAVRDVLGLERLAAVLVVLVYVRVCVVGILAVVLFRRALARVQLPEFLELVAAASSSAMVTVPMVVLSISWPPSQKDAAGETRSIV